LRKEAFF